MPSVQCPVSQIKCQLEKYDKVEKLGTQFFNWQKLETSGPENALSGVWGLAVEQCVPSCDQNLRLHAQCYCRLAALPYASTNQLCIYYFQLPCLGNWEPSGAATCPGIYTVWKGNARLQTNCILGQHKEQSRRVIMLAYILAVAIAQLCKVWGLWWEFCGGEIIWGDCIQVRIVTFIMPSHT